MVSKQGALRCRAFSGQEDLEVARQQRDQAKNIEQFRQALAILMPLELGLSLEQVALLLERSKGATCTLRTRFIVEQNNPAQV